MYEIDKKIEIPESRGGVVKYPFGKMALGDSFYFDGSRSNLANASFSFGKNHGMKFTVRMEGQGFRCWRIA